MFGRRIHSRFRNLGSRAGSMRLLRDVGVEVGEMSSELAILSDAPGVVDEELTLALVSSAGEMDLRVRVVESRPEVIGGAVRHRVRMQLLSVEMPPRGEKDRSTQR